MSDFVKLLITAKFGLVSLARGGMCIVVVYLPKGMLFQSQALRSIPLALLIFSMSSAIMMSRGRVTVVSCPRHQL